MVLYQVYPFRISS